MGDWWLLRCVCTTGNQEERLKFLRSRTVARRNRLLRLLASFVATGHGSQVFGKQRGQNDHSSGCEGPKIATANF
jgi:hypothetical protein